MIVVVDASVLVAELLRRRGRELFAHPDLRDPHDWAPVALAIALDAAILTGDHDFLGCGCPTWTVETPMTELGRPEA